MVEKDPETGLPKLPDGLFWTIGKSVIKIQTLVEETEWKFGNYLLSTQGQVARRTVAKQVERKLLGIKYKKTHLLPEWKILEYNHTVYEKKYGEWGFPRHHSVEEIIKPDPIDRLNIWGRCVETLREYNSKLEQEELLGSYPPNKVA